MANLPPLVLSILSIVLPLDPKMRSSPEGFRSLPQASARRSLGGLFIFGRISKGHSSKKLPRLLNFPGSVHGKDQSYSALCAATLTYTGTGRLTLDGYCLNSFLLVSD